MVMPGAVTSIRPRMIPAMPSSKKNHQMLDCCGCKAVVVMATSLLHGSLRACAARLRFIADHSLPQAGRYDAVLGFRTGIARVTLPAKKSAEPNIAALRWGGALT